MLWIIDTVEAAPKVIYVQQAAPGLPEWIKILITAVAGVAAGLITNSMMEFIKPYIAKRILRNTVAAILVSEIEENLSMVGSLSRVVRIPQMRRNDLEQIRYWFEKVDGGRFDYYLENEKMLVYELDNGKMLETFYRLAIREIPEHLALTQTLFEPEEQTQLVFALVNQAVHSANVFLLLQERARRPLYQRVKQAISGWRR